jgi:hypothetical protein
MEMLLGVATVIVVAATSLSDESVAAMDQALRSVLGSDASVTVRRERPDDDERTLRSLVDDSKATLVGVVSADGAERATLHFTRQGEARWSDREIRFEAADAPQEQERGRTIGFALASIVPQEPRLPAPPAEANAAKTEPLVRERDRAEPNNERNVTIDAVGLVASGISGFGGGGGGALAARLPLRGSFRVRLALGARAGEIAPAQAASRAYFLGAGLAWQPWLDAERSLAVGARLDVLALGEELAHLSADDPEPDRRFRVLPGLSLALEGTWRFARTAAFVGAFGSELALGETNVYVKGRQVATVVPLRGIGELGLRVTF